MTARPFILGNWKMHHGVAESRAFAQAYLDAHPSPLKGLDVGIAPPATALWALCEAGLGDVLSLCGQDAFYEDKGAFTGAISAAQLRDAGAHWLLCGHSERRRHFHDTDADIAKRVAAGTRAGLRPVICVGESQQEREQGRGEDVLRAQLEALLPVLPKGEGAFSLAYEPVWAIGGRVADTRDIAKAHGVLRERLVAALGEAVACSIPIAYGGGVKVEDVDAIARAENVDGLLVGGASLSASSFIAIVAAMQHVVGEDL